MSKKVDELYDLYIKLFKKYGSPRRWKKKYNITDDEKIKKCTKYYDRYKLGRLKENIAISHSGVPRINVIYEKNIDDLIEKIGNEKHLDFIEVICVLNEINNIDELVKLREKYPDKDILLKWDSELAYIDDIISAIYMINYYKSVISDNMSPLEKVMMAYDLAKSFYYKNSKKNDPMKSRFISRIVNNDDFSIVCVGFAKIFNRILNEIGIKAMYMRVTNEKDDSDSLHARCFVKIDDEKYGISGYFLFDPTYDSADKDYYYRIDDNNASKSSQPKDGLKQSNPANNYLYFLIPIYSYESVFPGSCNELISLPGNKKLSESLTVKALHNNQAKDRVNALAPLEFVKLLYNVKLAEGYLPDDMPKIIQEALYVSGYKPYTLESVIRSINNIQDNENQKVA